MRNPEYDRFGPWVIEINEEDPPPPLFLPYVDSDVDPLISIKIPRKIERRKANPGMNLYDYLVTLFGEEIEILERVGDQVIPRRFAYRDIQFICFCEELLKGTLTLAFPDQTYNLPFNTVSKELMRHIVRLMRQRYAGQNSSKIIPQEAEIDHDELSFYYAGLVNEQANRNSQFKLIATQFNTPVASLETDALRKLFFGVISKTLLETLHFSDGRELKIIGRGKTYKYKWQTIYGSATYTIPIDKIQSVAWVGDEEDTAITEMQIQTTGGVISHSFIRTNSTLSTYRNFLAEKEIAIPKSAEILTI